MPTQDTMRVNPDSKPDVWMPFDWPKFQAATIGMRREAKWSYFNAICAYWWGECFGLENSDESLRMICECPEVEWARTKGAIFGRFFTLGPDGNWHQKGARERYEKAVNDVFVAQDKARRAAEERWKKERKPEEPPKEGASADAQAHAQADAQEILLNNNTKYVTEIPVEPLPGFPKTKELAAIDADFIGCPREFAEAVWNKAMSRGGRDAKDVAIRQWRHYLATEWGYERSRIEQLKIRNANNSSNRKPNPRNATTGVDTTEQGRQIAAHIARKAAQKAAA